MTVYIYCSENNFINKLKIDENYQELEIDTKKDQYYYEIDYTQKRSSYNTNLSINFNLNDKNFITITLKIELNYISSIAWMCISLGCFFMIPALYYSIKYIINYCKEKKKEKEELNERLNKSIITEKLYQVYENEMMKKKN